MIPGTRSLNPSSLQPPQSDEFTRRQTEWDRQMVNLDQKQTELLDVQWTLIREQTGALARELSALRSDMSLLKKECLNTTDFHAELQGQHSTLLQRVAHLEEYIGESSDKGAKALDEAHAKLNDAHGAIAVQRKAHEDHVATMEQRLAYIERQMGDSADTVLLRQEMDRDKKHRDKILDGHSELKEHHANLRERMEYIEKFIGESADKHAKLLEDAHNKIKDQSSKMQQIADSHGGHKVTMEERLEAVESYCKGKLKEQQDKLQDITNAHGGHKTSITSLEDQVTECQQMMKEHQGRVQDMVGGHKAALDACNAKLKDSHGQLMDLANAHGGHKATLDERLEAIETFIKTRLKDHQDDFLKQIDGHKNSVDAKHSAHSEMLDDIQGKLAKLDTSHGGHRQKVDERFDAYNSKLKDHQNSLQEALDAHHGVKATMEERMENVEAFIKGKLREQQDQFQKHVEGHKAAMDARHTAHNEKFDDLHGKLSKLDASHNGHKQRMDERLDSYNSRFKDQQGQLQEMYDSHLGVKGAMEDRLSSVDSFIRGVHDKHSASLEDLQSKLTDAHGIIKGEKAAREQHHATVEQRLVFLEKQIGDKADNHLKQIEELERKHKALSNKMDDVHGNVKGEKEMREKHHASINDRVEYLEKFVGDSADKHDAAARALETYQKGLKDVHGNISKHQAELLARQQHHATMEQRMEFLEKQLGDSADNHQKLTDELENLKGKHKKISQDYDALHGHVKGEKDAREQHHATVEERLQYLEQFVGDSADKHAKAVKDLEAAHSRIKDFHGHMVGVKANQESHKANMEERLEFLERQIGDSADRHSEELEALKGNHSKLSKTLDQLHGHIKGEKDQREKHHATIEERVNFLETTVGDSADKHDKMSKQLDAAHSSLKDIHGKHTSEKSAREAHHASLEERLDYIEKCIGDSADKHNGHINELNDLKDRLRMERSARDTHASHVKDQLDRHEKARQAHHDTLKDGLANERSAREAAHQSLQDLVHKEKASRDKHHATYQEFLDREKAAREQHRNSIDDLLAREKAERFKHHDTIGERVDSLERTVGIFDEISRKEQGERKAELRRVWDAIDNHTHDLSTSISKDDTSHVEDSKVRETTRYAPVVRAASVVTPVRRIEPTTVYSPPMTTKVISAPATTVLAASSIPVVKPLPAYEAPQLREVVREIPVREIVREREASPMPHSHATETITCGHTRYGGQSHASAKVPLS